MSDRVDAYAQAILEICRVEGNLADVEDELFRFARVVEENDQLRMALTDPSLPVERRLAVVDDLLGKTALTVSKAAVSLIISINHAHNLSAIVDRFIEISAEHRDVGFAEVRTAVPLDAKQQERLAKALSNATGKKLEIRALVDPTVIGGVVSQIGDLVIDGSVRSRLAQLKEHV